MDSPGREAGAEGQATGPPHDSQNPEGPWVCGIHQWEATGSWSPRRLLSGEVTGRQGSQAQTPSLPAAPTPTTVLGSCRKWGWPPGISEAPNALTNRMGLAPSRCRDYELLLHEILILRISHVNTWRPDSRS